MSTEPSPCAPTVDPLPYEDRLDARPLGQIDLVVIHCTELPDLAMARHYGERILHASGTGNSGHYYIDRDGSVHVYVRPDRIAHHVRGYNPRSVGIELVNTGRYPDWLARGSQKMEEPYTGAQIASLTRLLADTGTAESVRVDAVEQGGWLTVTLRAECLEEIGREVPLTDD